MRRLRHVKLSDSAVGGYGLAALAAVMLVGSAFAAFSDESTGRPVTRRDLAAIKADLQALVARVADVEGDALQTRDNLDNLRDEVIALKAESRMALDSVASSSPLNPVAPEAAKIPAALDVDVTGSVAKPQPLSAAEEKQLARAEQLIAVGDIAGARMVLERALRGGHPAVALKLAETYDPEHLASWHVLNMHGDPQKARALYLQAQLGGVQQTAEVAGHR